MKMKLFLLSRNQGSKSRCSLFLLQLVSSSYPPLCQTEFTEQGSQVGCVTSTHKGRSDLPAGAPPLTNAMLNARLDLGPPEVTANLR